MKIAVSSDWHGRIPNTREEIDIIKSCDVLLLAGDIFESNPGYLFHNLDSMGRFFQNLRDSGVRVIMTPGNHDFHLYNGWLLEHPKEEELIAKMTLPRLLGINSRAGYTSDFFREFLGIEVLIDDYTIVDGLKIYGTPWSLEFCRWAFMLPTEGDLAEIYKKIPEDTDILLAHTPPIIYGSRIDTVYTSPEMHLGSRALGEAIEKRPNLGYVFCGHIHSGDHEETLVGKNTKCYNVSYLGEDYKPTFPIRVVIR